MKHQTRTRRLAATAIGTVLMCCALLVVACSAAQPTGPAALPKPGLRTSPDGSADAYGWVRHNDIEGGFWELSAVPPGSTEQTGAVAVLLPAEVAADAIAAADGAYVHISGTVVHGVSTRMAGPELQVNILERLNGR